MKFSNISLLALFVAAAFVLDGCGTSSSSITDTAAKASVVELPTPAGWTRQTNYPISAGVSADLLLKGPAVANFYPNILVMTSPTEGIAVDSASKLLKASLASQGYSIDSSKAASIGGKPGWIVQYRGAHNTAGTMVQRMLLVVHAGKDCQIVMSRAAADGSNEAIFLAEQAAIVLN